MFFEGLSFGHNNDNQNINFLNGDRLRFRRVKQSNSKIYSLLSLV